MAKYEMAIAVEDHAGALAHNEGDIIAVCQYPHNWGLKELDEYLIVIVDKVISNWNIIRGILQAPRYSTPGDSDTDIIAKRQLSIPLANLKTNFLPNLDLTKVRDVKAKYQPCKSATQLTSIFDGSEGRYSLTTGDVDCIMPGTGSDVEYTINFANNLIYNKDTASYLGVL